MSTWLRDEVKWASQKTIEAQTELDQLRDPMWRDAEVARQSRAVRKAQAELAIARDALKAAKDDEAWAAKVAHKAREVEDWKRMASAARDRVLDTEQGGLFEEVGQ